MAGDDMDSFWYYNYSIEQAKTHNIKRILAWKETECHQIYCHLIKSAGGFPFVSPSMRMQAKEIAITAYLQNKPPEIEAPNGRTEKYFADYDYIKGKAIEKECFYHPVQFRKDIVSTFNLEKSKVQELIDNKEKVGLVNYIEQMIKTDIILFSLLKLWVTIENDSEPYFWNPDRILKVDEDYYRLSEEEDYSDRMLEFRKLRVINKLD